MAAIFALAGLFAGFLAGINPPMAAVLAGLLFLLLALLLAAMDYARISLVLDPGRSIFRHLGRGLAFMVRRFPGVLLLAMLFWLATLLISLVYPALAAGTALASALVPAIARSATRHPRAQLGAGGVPGRRDGALPAMEPRTPPDQRHRSVQPHWLSHHHSKGATMAVNTTTMTPRERVLAALNHQEPDRVPMDFGGTRCTSIHLAGYERLKAHLGIDAPSIISDRMMQCVLVDDRILERFGVDTRCLVPGVPDGTPDVELGERHYRDEWGVERTMPAGSYWYDLVSSPLAGEITVADIARTPGPTRTTRGRVRGVRQRALALKAKGDYAIVLNVAVGTVHISQYLRGFKDWFMDMAADQKLIGALMDAITEVTGRIVVNLLREVGDLVDIVFTGDDLGTQGDPRCRRRPIAR